MWFLSFCALVRCGRAIRSDVVPLSPMWFDMVITHIVVVCRMILSHIHTIHDF